MQIDLKNPQQRRKFVEHMLTIQDTVFLHLDGRAHGVVVPARLRTQPQVVLQVGHNMPVPIPDLRLDHAGVYGTLSFKGVPYTCFVPWDAIFAVVGEDGKAHGFGSVPVDALAQAGMLPGVPSLAVERGKRKHERGKPQSFHKKSTTPNVRPSYLRVVK